MATTKMGPKVRPWWAIRAVELKQRDPEITVMQLADRLGRQPGAISAALVEAGLRERVHRAPCRKSNADLDAEEAASY